MRPGLKPCPCYKDNRFLRGIEDGQIQNELSHGPRTFGKVRPHQTQNEALLFEKSSPGKRAYKLPPLDVPAVDAARAAWRGAIAQDAAACCRS